MGLHLRPILDISVQHRFACWSAAAHCSHQDQAYVSFTPGTMVTTTFWKALFFFVSITFFLNLKIRMLGCPSVPEVETDHCWFSCRIWQNSNRGTGMWSTLSSKKQPTTEQFLITGQQQPSHQGVMLSTEVSANHRYFQGWYSYQTWHILLSLYAH